MFSYTVYYKLCSILTSRYLDIRYRYCAECICVLLCGDRHSQQYFNSHTKSSISLPKNNITMITCRYTRVLYTYSHSWQKIFIAFRTRKTKHLVHKMRWIRGIYCAKFTFYLVSWHHMNNHTILANIILCPILGINYQLWHISEWIEFE